MSHPWLPTSPCGDGCLPGRARRAGPARVAARFASLTALALALPVLLLAGGVLPRTPRQRLQCGFARAVLRGLGLRLQVRDDRTGPAVEAGRGTLVVAGHVSWTDVLVLTALGPADFVARADLLQWPLLGRVAGRMRVIPIERERLGELRGAVDEAAERLRTGGRVVAFPEATTWCGRAYGGLRPAMFQSAIDADALVQPVGIRYCGRDGELDTTVCFVGEQTLVGSLRRILGTRRVLVQVRLAPAQEPGECRRDLAARCDREVRAFGDADAAAGILLERGLARRQSVAA